jgi:hypothetical protein
MPTTTVVFSGAAGAIGCDYRLSDNKLVFVEYASGKLSAVNVATHAYTVFGTGYTNPEDVKLSADGSFAYVTERAGNLLRVDLPNAPRSSATVIASGMTAPQQMALDPARMHAYVVEYAPSGRLLRIDLPTGTKTIVATGLSNAVGVVVKADLSYAYVSEQGTGSGAGRITRIRLADGHRDLVAGGLTEPFFLTWASSAQTSFYFTERGTGAASRVSRVDLVGPSPTVAVLDTGLPTLPSSVAVKADTDLLVCCNAEILDVDFAPYAAAGPLVLGIGLIPSTSINPVTGLATTAPGYLLQVTNSPFGGSLAVMINYDHARALGAAYYQLDVDGVQPRQSFVDYLWNGTTFVATTTSPDPAGFYPVRAAGALWYNHWLGYVLDTAVVSNAIHTLRVTLFNAAHAPLTIPPGTLRLMVDNRLPTADITQIDQNHVPIPPCGNATKLTGPDLFTFGIVATHPENLSSWTLDAYWGLDKSARVASGGSNFIGQVPVPPAPQWSAAVSGDPSSTDCGHTFILGVWDRVTDGYTLIHYAEGTDTIDIRF